MAVALKKDWWVVASTTLLAAFVLGLVALGKASWEQALVGLTLLVAPSVVGRKKETTRPGDSIPVESVDDEVNYP